MWPFRKKSQTVKDSEPIIWGNLDWSGYRFGTGVSEARARAISAVTACVNIIAGSIAGLPVHVYRRDKEGNRARVDDDIWWLLNERAAPDWSAFAFWERMVSSRLLRGDAYAAMIRGVGGRVTALVPVHPDDAEKRGNLYRMKLPGDLESRVFEDADVLHIPGVGYDGTRSLSPLQYELRYSAGIAATTDDLSDSYFSNGMRQDVVLEVPNNMSEDSQKLLRDSFVSRHSGTAPRVPIVASGGLKVHPITLTAEDSELLEARRFQIEDICRAMGVPPHMVGATDKTTSWGTGIEQMSIGFVKYTLMRHISAFEQEMNHKFFRRAGKFIEFSTGGLERGDMKTRFESYRIALGRAGESPWTTVDEIRRLENMPPMEVSSEEPIA